MTEQEREAFRDYLQHIEDELLQAVAADYIWLSARSEDHSPYSRFYWRRNACREECARRGKLRIWRSAERSITGPVGQVA